MITRDLTVLYSSPLRDVATFLSSSFGFLVTAPVFVITTIQSAASIPRGEGGLGETLVGLLVLLFLGFICIPISVFSLRDAASAVQGIVYNRAFHPPLLLLSGAPRLGAHVRVSYIHQRTGRGPYRAGFVLSQLVAATHSELLDGGEPGADFGVLWSSDVEVTPISKGGGAVSFEQEIDLPEHLPGPGPVTTSGKETFKEVVWYLRTREVLWPRSEYTYQFVLPVEPAPGRQGPAVTPH